MLFANRSRPVRAINMSLPKQSKTCGHKDEALDRFIPLRSSTWESQISGLTTCFGDTDDASITGKCILEKELRSCRRREYHRLLEDAMFPDGVLGLGPGQGTLTGSRQGRDHRWPVKARSDPLVGDPQWRLQMPDVPKSNDRLGWLMNQLMDWGACGILAVAGSSEVYLWRDGAGGKGATELLTSFADDVAPLALCWSPHCHQPLLLIGTTDASRVQLWDCDRKELRASRRMPDGSPVIGMAWHPHQDIIAVGTLLGFVHLLTSSLVHVASHEIHPGPRCGVSKLAFSAVDGALLACGGTAGNVVIWDWRNGGSPADAGRGGIQVDMASTITALCWHPWKSTIAAAGSLSGHITLMNFSTRRCTMAQYKDKRGRPMSVTALSFAPRTGELVVAFGGKGVTEVVVLSGLTTVVDRLETHTASVRYLSWSPDGAVLATASTLDEMLCLWNFLGAKVTRDLRKKALQDARERRSGVRRQFGCIIR